MMEFSKIQILKKVTRPRLVPSPLRVGSAEFIVKEVLYFFVGRGFISKMPVA